jgi:DNA-binding FadR family transcriptional regulator
MELYEVSRTVVREAISHFAGSRTGTYAPRCRTFIQEPPLSNPLSLQKDTIVTVRDVLDILELRISLETEAAWLAASRRTEEQMAAITAAFDDIQRHVPRDTASVNADMRFHQLIAKATGNRYFVDILSDLATH